VQSLAGQSACADFALISLVGIYGNVQSLAGNTLLEMVHALIAAMKSVLVSLSFSRVSPMLFVSLAC